MKKRRWTIAIILVICVLVLVFLQTPWGIFWFGELRSGVYKIKMDAYCRRLEASFDRQAALYEEVAQDFLSSPEDPYYNFRGTSHNVTQPMLDKIQTLQEDCPVDFDTIYLTNDIHLEYPTGACIFSTTVESSELVYGWVELVYSTESLEPLFKDYQEALADGIVTELSEDWYIMIHYGY